MSIKYADFTKRHILKQLRAASPKAMTLHQIQRGESDQVTLCLLDDLEELGRIKGFGSDVYGYSRNTSWRFIK